MNMTCITFFLKHYQDQHPLQIEKRSVELLADIQQRQDAESEGVITNIATLDVGGMSELRQSVSCVPLSDFRSFFHVCA